MADKEERISVIVYEKDPCENCPGNPMTDCQVCEKDLRYDSGITRQKAVEIMAKAIYFKACGTMKDYARCKKVYIPFAEAALDALLGEKK